MTYSAEISRENPSCFLFLIDRSGSMSEAFGGQPGKRKSDGVADAINRIFQNLVIKCAKSEGVRDYYHVGVIGYGAEVGPALAGSLAGRDLVPISEIADNPLRVEQRVKKVDDGAGGLVDQTIKFPVWFEPIADGMTPMCKAIELARRMIGEFISRYPNCYPPIVINITDGKANDGDPAIPSRALRSLSSTDGPVLFFNAHVSSRPDKPVEFPNSESQLPDDFARLLFGMSSKLPPSMQDSARREMPITDETRGFVFNADLVAVIRFLDIGTKVAQGLR